MKKACIITVVLAVLLTGTVVLAAESVVYSDEQLGFSFEMPADFEYYGDISAEVVETMDAEKVPKHPLYVGYDSNIVVMYDKDKEAFDSLSQGLPNGIKREEIDFYLLSQDKREEYAEGISKAMNVGDVKVMSSDWVDYGGKLCLYTIVKGYDSESGLSCYMGSLNFMYMDNYIIVSYTKYDVDESFSYDVAKAQFDECFSTLKFAVVPSNKDAKFKSGAIIRLEALVDLIIGLVSVPGIIILVVWLYKKRKNKYVHKL